MYSNIFISGILDAQTFIDIVKYHFLQMNVVKFAKCML